MGRINSNIFGMRLLIFYGLFVLFSLTARGQSSVSKIRESRDNTLKEIEYANRLLQETQGKTKQSLNEVNIINHRLAKRKEYLTGLEVEVNVLQEEIEKNQQDISRTEQEINKIKKMYAMMIRNLYKNKITDYQTMYFVA
jgi:septal ring factor EnvC (AmiA/AmiB activator)